MYYDYYITQINMTTVIQWLSKFQNIHQYCQSSCPSSPSSSTVGSGKFLYLALSWAIFCSAERSRFAFSFRETWCSRTRPGPDCSGPGAGAWS